MTIAQLQPLDTAHVDPEILAGLHSRLGQVGAEQALTSAVEQSLARVAAIRTALEVGNTEGARQLAVSLAELAERSGMTTYARVAHDVAACAAGSCDVALAATFARLERIGDKSMLALWGLEDISG